jgi:hypothetical protein
MMEDRALIELNPGSEAQAVADAINDGLASLHRMAHALEVMAGHLDELLELAGEAATENVDDE